MSTAADAFFEEASPPKDMEWTPPRTQPEVSPQSSQPWYILLCFVALGVVMQVLIAREMIEGPSIIHGLGWSAALSGCAIGTLILARSRDAVTSRHVADAALLAIATGGFTWVFPHYNGVIIDDIDGRIGVVLINAGAGLLVGSLIVLALARARTSVATVSFLMSCLLMLAGATFFRSPSENTIGLLVLVAAWAFAIAGWKDRARGPRQRPPDSATLRSPRSMVSFATAACSAFALREAFASGTWADELPAILLLGLMFVAALVSVFDARRQIAESPSTINNWREWRASVETGAFEGETQDGALVDEPPVDGSLEDRAAGASRTWAPSPRTGELELAVTTEESGAIPGAWDPGDSPVTDEQPIWRASTPGTQQPTLATIGPRQPESDEADSAPATFIPVPTSPSGQASPTAVPVVSAGRLASELEAFPAASAWTVEGELLGANAAFWDLSKSAPSDGFGLLQIVHPDDRPGLALQVTRGTRANLPFSSVVRLIDPATREQRHIDVVGGPFDPSTSPLGNVANATYQVSCNTPRPDHIDDEVSMLGLFDPLTGLGNSAYLERWLSKRTGKTRRRNDRPLLIVVELADLGQYEQSEPRLRDVIMTEAAHAMHKACRAGDFVVRLDGPYFAAVVEEVIEGEEWYLLQRFEHIVKGVFTIAGRPFKIDGRLLPLRPNAGALLDDILDQVAALLVAGSPAASTSEAAPEASPHPVGAAAGDAVERDVELAVAIASQAVTPNEAATANEAVTPNETASLDVPAAETAVTEAESAPDAVVTQLFRPAPTARKTPAPDPRALGGYAVPPSSSTTTTETNTPDADSDNESSGEAEATR